MTSHWTPEQVATWEANNPPPEPEPKPQQWTAEEKEFYATGRRGEDEFALWQEEQRKLKGPWTPEEKDFWATGRRGEDEFALWQQEQLTPPTTTPPPGSDQDQPLFPELPEMPDFGAGDFKPLELPDLGSGMAGITEQAVQPLFTPENMSAEEISGFLQKYVDQAGPVQPEETVFGQLEKVLNEDNALFDWARGEGRAFANQRGLVNSSIAAEASSQAVMGAALPIAMADAQVYAQAAAQQRQFWFTAGLQAFDATIQSGLMAQDHMQQMVQLTHQGNINSRLQLEQFGYNWALSEQRNFHNMQLAALQGNIQAGLALQEFGFDTNLLAQDYGYRLTLQRNEIQAAIDLSVQENEQWIERIMVDQANTLERIELQGEIATGQQETAFTQNLQQNYLISAERLTTQYVADVNRINSTEGLTPTQQRNANNIARSNYENAFAQLGRQYSSSPGWDPNWEIEPISTPGNTSGLQSGAPGTYTNPFTGEVIDVSNLPSINFTSGTVQAPQQTTVPQQNAQAQPVITGPSLPATPQWTPQQIAAWEAQQATPAPRPATPQWTAEEKAFYATGGRGQEAFEAWQAAR